MTPQIIPVEAVKMADRTAKTMASTPVTSPSSSPPLPSPREDGTLALMLTRRCNISCAHCSVESGPRVGGEPDMAWLLKVVAEAAQSGIRGILLTGGEPMLRPEVVMELLRQCRAAGLGVSMTSNGFWGKTEANADATVQALQAAGLGHLTISYDRYHAAFMGPEPVVHIARAAQNAGLSLFINITRTAQDGDLSALIAPFAGLEAAQLRFYDVQPLGRAREIEGDLLRSETRGFCNACSAATITDDGRVTACNGPSYFSPLHSPLQVGNLRDEPLGALLERHRSDPILETIRTFGPAYLHDELAKLPGFESFARADYRGICDLCLHINSDAGAVAALRNHLEAPRFAVARLAARRIIASERSGGEFDRHTVNTAGAARLWWRAALDPKSLEEPGAARLLGRADLDWSTQLSYLTQCGMGGVLAPLADGPILKRWAPQFFRDGLKNDAMHGAMRENLQREAMREISAVLREIGARGVLLKSCAMLAVSLDKLKGLEGLERDATAKTPVPARFGCDLDVYIAPSHALRVRTRLLERGFRETRVSQLLVRDALGKRHQLDGLTFNGLTVEIHQTLLPEFCGLPEREMLAQTRPLDDPELQALAVLSGEAMLLHSLMHWVKHVWSNCLKTAWDVHWILDHTPDFRWDQLALWLRKTGARRGFWVAAQVLNRELGLNLPPVVFTDRPDDARQKRLESIARRALFGPASRVFASSNWLYLGLELLLIDSWPRRARAIYHALFSPYCWQMRRENPVPTAPRLKRWLAQGQQIRRATRSWKRGATKPSR